MSCPYYWYNNHFACRKSGKDVNEDIYYKYCRNYDYGDCPIYKGNDTSGCFLTSACTEAKGLPDDCYELTTLRRFRDEYLAKQECGPCEIRHYYQTAPSIVAKIKAGFYADAVFDKIYDELVVPCVKLIEQGKLERAHEIYREYILMLENQEEFNYGTV